ncbi:unnamed protein product [Aphanomyces euteiches]
MKVPEDYAEASRLMSEHYSESVNVERMIEEDAIVPLAGSLGRDENGLLTGHDRVRFIAEDEEGRIYGYGHAWRAPWSPAGVLFQQIIVDAQERGKGIGSAIYKRLVVYSTEVGSSRIVYDVHDNDLNSQQFAANRGFIVERHQFESVINLAKTELVKEHTEDPAIVIAGISLVSLKDIPGEETEKALYELYRQTQLDIPGFEGEFMWYGEWRKRTMDRADFDPALLLLAMDGQRPVGVVELLAFGDRQSLYNNFTGVDSDYRGRGIASALKQLSINLARQRKFAYIRTNNDSLNKPMLTINQKLGFMPVPGNFQMIKR